MLDLWLARLEVNLVQRHSFIDKRPSTGNIYGPVPDDAEQPRPSRSSVRPKRVGLTPHRQKRFLYHTAHTAAGRQAPDMRWPLPCAVAIVKLLQRLKMTWTTLTALGITGGLVPSASALVILLAAISL